MRNTSEALIALTHRDASPSCPQLPSSANRRIILRCVFGFTTQRQLTIIGPSGRLTINYSLWLINLRSITIDEMTEVLIIMLKRNTLISKSMIQ